MSERVVVAGTVKGCVDGPAASALFNQPFGVAVDRDDNLIVADTTNQRIRKITSAGVVSTVLGVSGWMSFRSRLSEPVAVAVDQEGNIFVADSTKQKIRRITTEGIMSTLAGSSHGFRDGPGLEAQFDKPTGIAVDGRGNIIVADCMNNRIRIISPDGFVSVLAGSGARGYQDGPGAEAQFREPAAVAIDRFGCVIVADTGNRRIRRVDNEGVVSTIAGSGESEVKDGSLASASFDWPGGVAVDRDGNIFVSDTLRGRIRKVSSSGVSTLRGQFSLPHQLALDGWGSLWVAESGKHRIVKIPSVSYVSHIVDTSPTECKTAPSTSCNTSSSFSSTSSSSSSAYSSSSSSSSSSSTSSSHSFTSSSSSSCFCSSSSYSYSAPSLPSTQSSSSSYSFSSATDTAPPPSPDLLLREKSLKRGFSAEHSSQSGNECVVCLDRQKIYAVDPCFHLCLCEQCGMKLFAEPSPKCPLCIRRGSKLIRIYS